MTFDRAMSFDVGGATVRELDAARAAIGEWKLSLRKRFKLVDILGRLRPANRRIDEINDEDAHRQAEGRRERRRRELKD